MSPTQKGTDLKEDTSRKNNNTTNETLCHSLSEQPPMIQTKPSTFIDNENDTSGKDPDMTDNESPEKYILNRPKVLTLKCCSGNIKCKKIYMKEDEQDPEEETESEKKRIFVEKSPKGRFQRFNEELGSGAQKRVYLAFDHENGREVAWNAISVNMMTDESIVKIKKEIEILKMLRHPNIISFIYGFYNEDKKEIVIITELLSGGSLRHYLNIYKHPRLRVIKIWCKGILQGLKYLHEYQIPIIHRDIKCDNILISKNNGDVKIADLGLSRMLKTCGYCNTFSGTAEFCSPEVYLGKYGVKADIYSFGMCMLEMVTNERPYKECEGNVLQICDRATKGIMPQSFEKIRNVELRDFIHQCLRPENERPTAKELLESKFLNDLDSEPNNYPALDYPPLEPDIHSSLNTTTASHSSFCRKILGEGITTPKHKASQETISLFHSQVPAPTKSEKLKNSNPANPPSPSRLSSNRAIVEINEEETTKNIAKIILKKKGKGKMLEIKFDFNFQSDTIEGVVNELTKVIVLSSNEQKEIQEKLQAILKYIKEKLERENEIQEHYKIFNSSYENISSQAEEIFNAYKSLIKEVRSNEVEEIERKMMLLEELMKVK